MPAPYYDDQRFVSEDEVGQRSRGSRQYPASNVARYERYEIDPPSLQARQDDMKGKKVMFYMSGDRDCRGVELCINSKIRTFGSLLAELDRHQKIKPKGGVRYIFRKDENRYRRIDDLSDIQTGDMLVVSDKPSIDKTINYGYPAGPSPTKGLQRSPLPARRSHKGPGPLRRSISRRTDTIVLINKERMTTYKLNPNTTQLFEQVLDDMGDMLKLGSYRPLAMHSAVPGNFTKIDSFTKLNSQLHATELKSSGKETPKFLICKNGENPEDALSDKMRKAFEKKGLIKPVEDEQIQDRYGDDGDDDQGYDQVEDGTPEPTHQEKRRHRPRDQSPTKYHDDPPVTSRRSVPQRYNGNRHERDLSPSKYEDDAPLTSRKTARQSVIPKSQSKENVGSKQNSHRTPRQTNNKTSRPSQRQQLEEETSSESQQNQEDSDSDSDYPEPRRVTPKKPAKKRPDTPEY